MIRHSRTALVLGLSLALSPLAQASGLPDARSLIDAHIAAVGGPEALLKGSEGTSRMQVKIAENGMTFDMTLYGRGGDRATLMSIPGAGDFRTGYVDGVAWGMDPMNGPRLLQGQELEQAVRERDPKQMTYDPSVIASATTTALSDSEGRPCHRVEIKWTSGRESAACFGTEDGLMLSTESVMPSPMGEIKQVSHIYDYKAYGEMKLPTRAKILAAGMTQLISLQSYDPAAPEDEVFALPPAIKALVDKASAGSASK